MHSEPHPELVAFIKNASQIMMFSGAGISTGSGIQDFRGPKGFWKNHQPVMYPDFMNDETARVEYWSQKLIAYPSFKAALPNAVHRACVQLEEAGKLGLLVTQNVDGLHRKAGTSEDKLVELHGTNTQVQCQTCNAKSAPSLAFEFFEKHRSCPRCECGGFLKPATISFGQNLDPNDLEKAAVCSKTTDLIIALGSTLSVYPAAEFPLIAAQRGTPYIIINRGPTEHDNSALISLRLEGNVVELFPPAVDNALQ